VGDVLDSNEEAREELGEAGVHLQTADDKLNDEATQAFNTELGNSDFDGERIRNSLDKAAEHINRARSEATGDYVDNVAAFQTVHDAFEDVTGEMETVVAVGNAFNRASDQMDREQYDEAIDTAESAQENTVSTVQTLEDIKKSVNSIEPENFSVDPDTTQPYFDLEETVENITQTIAFAEALRELTSSIIRLVRGTEHISAGNEALDNNQYADAENEYREAESLYREAREIAERTDLGDLSGDMKADIEEYICIISNLEEGTGLLADAAQAYEEGDSSRGSNYAEEASEVLNTEECGE
jgi:hypothetical protein